MGQVIQVLDQRLAENKQELDRKLSESNMISKNQSTENIRVIQDISRDSQDQVARINKQLLGVTQQMTKLDETNRQVMDFSSQLKNLQDILKNPKQRGVLGEYFLEETLKNVLPPNSYKMQYGFKDGVIVDAVVFVKEKIIPIDSKFSLETYEKLLSCTDAKQRTILEKQFKQDLKNRIDETSKYVKPNEQTVDFAFMFIPSEAIYYDLLVNKVGSAQVSSRDLIEYAFKDKHVIIVSPTSFLAYLQTVLQGLRALEIEESAKEIQKNVEKLGKHLSQYSIYHDKLGNTLKTTVNHFNNSSKEFNKVDKDIMKVTNTKKKLDLEGEEVESPKLEA
ncbi:DNA recombination protein RmuC [bacterium]|nr:DNA recombination protein RmuC [bacterium]MBT4251132.1 DNA recombination protein RmuC [bacterium]MBT4598076.1 DNA recombination protein RmuC [bacterium]MBT6753419.1 DNA recombination protein RmuC [bacterium]MBT7038132.1 DNA recombination protein RmuC [bacterium]